MSTVFDEQPDVGDSDLGNMDLEDRHALRRVAGLSTELQDISEVEYRALRLERVVLIGVWVEGSLASAENSLRELRRLAETAGSAAGATRCPGRPAAGWLAAAASAPGVRARPSWRPTGGGCGRVSPA